MLVHVAQYTREIMPCLHLGGGGQNPVRTNTRMSKNAGKRLSNPKGEATCQSISSRCLSTFCFLPLASEIRQEYPKQSNAPPPQSIIPHSGVSAATAWADGLPLATNETAESQVKLQAEQGLGTESRDTGDQKVTSL